MHWTSDKWAILCLRWLRLNSHGTAHMAAQPCSTLAELVLRCRGRMCMLLRSEHVHLVCVGALSVWALVLETCASSMAMDCYILHA